MSASTTQISDEPTLTQEEIADLFVEAYEALQTDDTDRYEEIVDELDDAAVESVPPRTPSRKEVGKQLGQHVRTLLEDSVTGKDEAYFLCNFPAVIVLCGHDKINFSLFDSLFDRTAPPKESTPAKK